MLRAGVEIHEISPASLASPSGRLGRFGRSIGRLHAKVAVIDRRLMFIGSMKARANTEVGLVIEAQRWSNKPRPRCFIASSTPRRTSCGSPRTGPTSSGLRPGPMAPLANETPGKPPAACQRLRSHTHGARGPAPRCLRNCGSITADTNANQVLQGVCHTFRFLKPVDACTPVHGQADRSTIRVRNDGRLQIAQRRCIAPKP